MTVISRNIVVIIMVLITGSLFGQKKDAIMMSPWKVKMFAKDAIEVGDIYTAIDYYEALTQAKPDNFKYKYELAHLYRKARNYKKAEELYNKAYEGNDAKFILALYYYALMQKMNGKYEDAEENMLKFRKKSKNIKDRRYYRKLVNNEVAGCQLAPVLMDSVLKVLVTHLDTSINKAHIDFAPLSVDKETMIYASMKADDVKYYDITDTSTVLPVRKFYQAKRIGFSKWKTTGELEGPINDEEYNVGNGAFSPDGKKFFFTKSYKNWENKMVSQLYVSKKIGERWGEPELMPAPVNDTRYTTTMPAIGTESIKNQEVIYFVSDRPGGKGGLDIWYTVWDKKKHGYKEPKNCGSKINSIGDEATPFFDIETRKLYFSSTGKPGLGGYDIFKTTGEMRRWSPPVNFGYPVNSSADDVYYAISKDRERSFFVSNREGGVALINPTCCDDIYEFRWTEYIHIGIEGFAFEKLDTTITDTLRNYIENLSDTVKGFNSTSIDSIPLDEDKFYVNDTLRLNNAVLSLYLTEFEGGKEESYLVRRMPADEEADYFFDLEQGNNYKIIAECDGYFNNQIKLSTKLMTTSDTLFESIQLKKIPLKSIVLDNIYYEFDKANLTEEAKQTIDTTILQILIDNPKLIVEISSHTDGKGNDDYNLKLSQKRAESVVKHLAEKNIDELRLIAKGYGETKPIALNKNPDGSDNPDGRKMNRRTEFKVIGSSDQFSRLNRSGMIIKRSNENSPKTFKTESE